MFKQHPKKSAKAKKSAKIAALLIFAMIHSIAWGEFESPQMPQAPTPKNPANEDGAGKDRQAQAAAAAGAAMAMMMCQMLMRQAMKEIDPAKKQMLMMMAMQQCNQAAQSANAANQNGKAKEKLTQNDTPKGLQLQPFKAPEATKDSELMKNLNSSPDDTPLDTGFELPLAQTETPSDKAKTAEFAFDSKSSLNPIENPKLNFQENSKGGGVTPVAAGASPAFLSAGTAKNLSQDELRSLLEERNLDKNGAKRGIAAQSGDDKPVAALSAGSSSGGDSKDFDSMLANLMGGGDGGLNSHEGAAMDVLAFGESEQTSNIFQYANLRYQQAADQKRLVAGKKRLPSQLAW